MAWLTFFALVVGSTAVSYVARERRHRRRWQLVEQPRITAGVGAYREGAIAAGNLAEAPAPLRAVVFLCIAYGRAVTFALLATAAYLAGAHTEALAVPTLHVMVGYFAAGGGVGAVVAMIIAALVMRASTDLLVRDPRRVFERTRATALASVALHGLVALNASTGAWIVGTRGRSLDDTLRSTWHLALAASLHGVLLLALAYRYRAELTATRRA